MLTFSEEAIEQIRTLMRETGEEDLALRVAILGRGPAGFRYDLAFVKRSDHSGEDVAVDLDAFTVFVDRKSAENLEGARVDFQDDARGRGFQIENPNTGWKDPAAAQVQRILDTRINPSIAMHGGFVTLHEVRDGIAFVSMGGGCQGCGLAMLTLKEGIEAELLASVPELSGVRDITDHASGQNPFYAPDEQGASPLS